MLSVQTDGLMQVCIACNLSLASCRLQFCGHCQQFPAGLTAPAHCLHPQVITVGENTQLQSDVHDELQDTQPMAWELDFAGVSVSFIDDMSKRSGMGAPTVQEILCCSVHRLRFVATVSDDVAIEMQAGYIQVDNQWQPGSTAEARDAQQKRGKYAVILAPTDQEKYTPESTPPVLNITANRIGASDVEHYEHIYVKIVDLTVSIDGDLVDRIYSKALNQSKHRSVWLLRGPAKKQGLREILNDEVRRFRCHADPVMAPRRLFIQSLQVMPFAVTWSHSGRPSFIAADGFSNVPVVFAKYSRQYVRTTHESQISQLQAIYVDQIKKKLPQFIGSSHVLGNPLGVVTSVSYSPNFCSS